MSLLFKTLYAWKAKGTHHKIALDALRFLECDDVETWRNLFLTNIDAFLDGSKAPDDQFKDFRNHVLHVGDKYWGGAVTAVESWYEKTVVALQNKSWSEAAFNAGVLSHYYSDPLMPFHTGQTEEEGIVHRAAEWSIACSYAQLLNLLETELGGYPTVVCGAGNTWLADMVRDGADASHKHYFVLIDHYNIKVGVKDPPAGLDAEFKRRVAPLLGHAIKGYAKILTAAIRESSAVPPATGITLAGVLTALSVPIMWVTKKMADAADRAVVQAIYQEFQATGKVIAALPPDEKLVRQLHAEEVLKVPLEQLDKQPVKPVGTAYVAPQGKAPVPAAIPKVPTKQPVVDKPAAAKPASPAPVAAPGVTAPRNAAPISASAKAPMSAPAAPSPAAPLHAAQPAPSVPLRAAAPSSSQSPSPSPSVTPSPSPSPSSASASAALPFYLELSSPVVDAPSIGPKTAERLIAVGIQTVTDLLRADPQGTATKINVRHIDAALIKDWQLQAQLVLQIPKLRGQDAQVLVAVGVQTPEHLASESAEKLVKRVESFADSPAGERVLRSGKVPDLDEIRDWIACARRARTLKAA